MAGNLQSVTRDEERVLEKLRYDEFLYARNFLGTLPRDRGGRRHDALRGARQSGMISAVGFEQYTSILEEAVAALRGQPLVRARDPELNVDVPGYIPDDYVPDTGQRLELYKRLSTAADEDEVALTLDEIEDRYGTPPAEVALLGELMVLKLHARALRAGSLDLTATRLSLALAEDTPLPADRVAEIVAGGHAAGSPYRLTPDMRLQRVFRGPELDDPVGAARRCLLELVGYATQSRQVEAE